MKIISINRYLSTFVLLLLSVIGLRAEKVLVKAELDSAKMLMGNLIGLNISVSAPDSVKTYFPLLEVLKTQPYISLLNDSVELTKDVKIDTVRQAGKEMINYHFLLQAFDSGSYRLPPFEFIMSSGDTLRSNIVSLTVLPVKVTADDKIDDFAHVVGPFDKEIPEGVNDDRNFLEKYWWIILIALTALGVAIWMWVKYRREGSILPVKKELPPYETAIVSLEKLKERKLWESGKVKEYYTALTKILRVYLDKRFGIMAMEMTSPQILHAFKKNDNLRKFRPEIRVVLDLSDFVKFAKVLPLADDNEKAFDNVKAFVEATKPVPEGEQKDLINHNQGSSSNQKKIMETGKEGKK